MKRKKVQMIIAGVVLVAVIAGGVFFTVFREGDSSGGNPDSAVYVDSVAELCGLGSGNGLTDRFAGVVEPQKTWEIELPSDKKVDEILVQEGDEVKVKDTIGQVDKIPCEISLQSHLHFGMKQDGKWADPVSTMGLS